MFGKKRVPLKDYCDGMLRHIFSHHYDDFAEALLDNCGVTYRDGIEREWYLQNLRAAVLQLLGVTFSRNLKRDQRYDAMRYKESFLEKSGNADIGLLYQEYNSAFGSDFQDGVRPMADLFSQNCDVPGVEPADISKLHYDAFYGVLRTFFDNIRSVKVV